MKSPRSLTAACFFFVLLAFNTAAQANKITAAEAKDHSAKPKPSAEK